MEHLVCRLEPLDPNVNGTSLPDGQEIILGRNTETNIQNVYCSKQQVALVADYKDQVVCITVCGRAESFVDNKSLMYGESCFVSNGSILELVRGSLKYRVVFTEIRKRDKSTDISKAGGKKDESFLWEQLCNSEVLLGTHADFNNYKRKVAAFDLDGTLIKTKSGNVFPKNTDDWTIWDESVKSALAEVNKNGYQVVIFTNQASLSMPKGKMLLKDFKKKVELIITYLGIPVCVYISTADGYYRKPAPGMWELMKSRIPTLKLNMMESFYVGDAAGRCADWKPGKKADFSASDRFFAFNSLLKFLTPEEFFLKEPAVNYPEPAFIPNKYDDTSLTDPEYTFPTDCTEVIMMVGSPASGKSHFVRTHLFPKQYHPVSRDNLGTWQKCVIALRNLLESNKNVVIDNTNPDIASRKRFLDICKDKNVRVRCFFMTTILERCLHNNKFRDITDSSHQTIKSHVIKNFHSTLEPPTLEEGFSEIVKVPFVPLFVDLDYERIYNYYLLC